MSASSASVSRGGSTGIGRPDSTISALQRATIGDLNGRLYEGVRQLRTLIVSEGWVLDFFQAASTAPLEFAWLTHVDGEAAGGTLRATTASGLQ